MQNLNQSILLSLVVGLPPLPEQHRIVAKVDELMALCDRFEASQTELECRRDTLAATSIHHLNNGASGEDFRRHANFYLGHLPHLTTRPAHIQQLRQTVLNLAVRGQLAPQDPTDEPASELFQRIQAWRKEAEGAKNVRAPRKSLQAVGETMPPYQLPDGWKWARLGELIYIHSGDGLTAETMNNGCIPVFGGNGITGYHDTPNIFQPSIVIGRVGYYCGSIHVTPAQAWVTDNAFITEFPSDQIVFDFLALLLRATNLKENEKATAQPVISGSKVYPIVVGLPPLIEQRRIVAKVDELMGICDRLEAQLTTGQAEGSRLLESVLHHALTCGDQIREEAQR
jgi:type I restriction enzyme S subunit